MFLCLVMPGRAPVFFSILPHLRGREKCAASLGHGDTVPTCLLAKAGWDAGGDAVECAFLHNKDLAVPLPK